jgi:hypothetical protein
VHRSQKSQHHSFLFQSSPRVSLPIEARPIFEHHGRRRKGARGLRCDVSVRLPLACPDALTFLYSAARNAVESPLLRLPAEIRNEIYTYVLTESPATYIFSHSRRLETGRVVGRAFRTAPHHVALLATCRQLHFDTRGLPFQYKNGLQFSGLRVFEITMLRLLPHQRDAVRRIEIKNVVFNTINGMVDRAVKRGHDDLRSIFPNAREVEVSMHYFPSARSVPRYQGYVLAPLLAAQDSLSETKFVSWLKGSNGKVRVVVDGKVA